MAPKQWPKRQRSPLAQIQNQKEDEEEEKEVIVKKVAVIEPPFKKVSDNDRSIQKQSTKEIPIEERSNTGRFRLNDLPPDIIHVIADHLAPSITGQLSLINKRMRSILSERVRLSFLYDPLCHRHSGHNNVLYCEKSVPQAFKSIFLQVLLKDMKDMFYCDMCTLLHPKKGWFAENFRTARGTDYQISRKTVCFRLYNERRVLEGIAKIEV